MGRREGGVGWMGGGGIEGGEERRETMVENESKGVGVGV